MGDSNNTQILLDNLSIIMESLMNTLDHNINHNTAVTINPQDYAFFKDLLQNIRNNVIYTSTSTDDNNITFQKYVPIITTTYNTLFASTISTTAVNQATRNTTSPATADTGVVAESYLRTEFCLGSVRTTANDYIPSHFYLGSNHRVPLTWRVPKCTARELWYQWWIGDKVNKIAPLRLINHNDVKHLDTIPLSAEEMGGRKGKFKHSRRPVRKTFHDLRHLIMYVQEKVIEKECVPTEITPQTVNDMFDIVIPDILTKKDQTLAWSSVGNRLFDKSRATTSQGVATTTPNTNNRTATAAAAAAASTTTTVNNNNSTNETTRTTTAATQPMEGVVGEL